MKTANKTPKNQMNFADICLNRAINKIPEILFDFNKIHETDAEFDALQGSGNQKDLVTAAENAKKIKKILKKDLTAFMNHIRQSQLTDDEKNDAIDKKKKSIEEFNKDMATYIQEEIRMSNEIAEYARIKESEHAEMEKYNILQKFAHYLNKFASSIFKEKEDETLEIKAVFETAKRYDKIGTQVMDQDGNITLTGLVKQYGDKIKVTPLLDDDGNQKKNANGDPIHLVSSKDAKAIMTSAMARGKKNIALKNIAANLEFSRAGLLGIARSNNYLKNLLTEANKHGYSVNLLDKSEDGKDKNGKAITLTTNLNDTSSSVFGRLGKETQRLIHINNAYAKCTKTNLTEKAIEAYEELLSQDHKVSAKMLLDQQIENCKSKHRRKPDAVANFLKNLRVNALERWGNDPKKADILNSFAKYMNEKDPSQDKTQKDPLENLKNKCLDYNEETFFGKNQSGFLYEQSRGLTALRNKIAGNNVNIPQDTLDACDEIEDKIRKIDELNQQIRGQRSLLNSIQLSSEAPINIQEHVLYLHKQTDPNGNPAINLHYLDHSGNEITRPLTDDERDELEKIDPNMKPNLSVEPVISKDDHLATFNSIIESLPPQINDAPINWNQHQKIKFVQNDPNPPEADTLYIQLNSYLIDDINADQEDQIEKQYYINLYSSKINGNQHRLTNAESDTILANNKDINMLTGKTSNFDVQNTTNKTSLDKLFQSVAPSPKYEVSIEKQIIALQTEITTLRDALIDAVPKNAPKNQNQNPGQNNPQPPQNPGHGNNNNQGNGNQPNNPGLGAGN